MKVLIILFTILILNAQFGLCQKYEKFKNLETLQFGLREKSTGKIVLRPAYKSLYNFNDSIISVSTISGEEGLLSPNGDTLVIFTTESTTLFVFTCRDDSLLQGSYMNYPHFLNGTGNMTFKFQVDKNRNCITNDFFPCPPDVPSNKVDTSNRYLDLINKSILLASMGSYDSVFVTIKQAISLAPDNPFPYYWLGKIFVDCPEYGLTFRNNEVVSKYYRDIETALIMSGKLEKITTRSIQIKKVQVKFYKYDIKDKKKLRTAVKELKELRKKRKLNCSLYPV